MSIQPVSRRSALKGLAGAAAISATASVGLGAGSASASTAPPSIPVPVAPGKKPTGITPQATVPVEQDAMRRAKSIVAKMTTAEKIAQLQVLYAPAADLPGLAKTGIGGIFWPRDAAAINAAQKVAVEQTRLGIPLIVGWDVIHGFHTGFPIPLAQGASFDPTVVTSDAHTGAAEARSVGVHWAFAPMIDVSHDQRWGRVAEGNGEDPFLTSTMGVAKIKGYQQDDYSQPGTLAATAKHFIAYGQPEGGRDYNTVDLSEQRLRNYYLPPFAAAVDAGVATVMASFNTINGVPAHANPHTLTEILRQELKFDGFVVSDADGIPELIAHGVADNATDAAVLSINSGVDVPIDTSFSATLAGPVKSGAVSIARLNEAVTRFIYIKVKLGLFENPYVDLDAQILEPTASTRAAARKAAAKTIVLLKNDRHLLPLSKSTKTVAVVGPLANSTDLLGAWSGPTAKNFPVTSVLAGVKAALPHATVTTAVGTDPTGADISGVAAAVRAAKSADAVVVVVGEPSSYSGEASARADITLPGDQEALVRAIADLGKPFTMVLVNGRALALENVAGLPAAIVEAWHGGSEAGRAVADVLFGDVNPGGKLPVTFPRTVGQIPIYYNHENTGRPYDPANPTNKFTSKYLDELPTPLYPFGHGLSFTDFVLDQVKLDHTTVSAAALHKGTKVTVSARLRNTGKTSGDEVVQLYIHDRVASIAQPVKRLRGFQRVNLKAGESRTVKFVMDASDLGFYTNNDKGTYVIEPGIIDIFVGNTSATTTSAPLTISK